VADEDGFAGEHGGVDPEGDVEVGGIGGGHAWLQQGGLEFTLLACF
jgi:hypothetical protein